MGTPGQQYFAGTHLNPKVTWWEKSGPFFSYINRCQWMLQQGDFQADVLYYYSNHVPNFTQFKRTDPARCGVGYDYDAITAEALLERASVKDGKIVLPDRMHYRVLVLPSHGEISLPVLKKIQALVNAGATVVGPRPVRAEALVNAAAADAEVKQIAGDLWGGQTGKGRVIADKTARQVLLADGVLPDCEFQARAGDFDYIHRQSREGDIYFVANRTNFAAHATVTFRVQGRAPELWNAVTGERQFAPAYEEQDGRTLVPLDFAPCGSWFVVFREPSAEHPAPALASPASLKPLLDIAGPWTVHFDPQWGGPATVPFDTLVSWPKRDEPGIKYYSGKATYQRAFDAPELGGSGGELWLDLGEVHELAEVKVNGVSCGIVWCPPFRVNVTDVIKPAGNQLEIEVVNFSPNRIIGDAGLPVEKRRTQTNIRKLNAQTPLEPAGLLGPVQLLHEDAP